MNQRPLNRDPLAQLDMHSLLVELSMREAELEAAVDDILKFVNPEFDVCPADCDATMTCTCDGDVAQVRSCWLKRWECVARESMATMSGGVDIG